MSCQILPFQRPMSAQRADGVFAAVNIAARRMGYSDDFALREARNAKLRFLRGDKSGAAVVAEAKAAMRVQSEGLLA